MKKKYIFILLIFVFGYSANSQTVIVEQLVDGTSGIVSDYINDMSFGTYASDDFILDNTYIIEVITVPGFNNTGDITTLMTGLDVYIYADTAGVPASNPNLTGTGLLEIIDLSPASTAITIVDNDITIDITAALGSELELSAGTYWLVVAPRVATLDDRWNWFSSSAGGNAMLFDDGNFGGGFDWTEFGPLGLAFDSLAFTISGTPALSVNEFGLNSIKIHPNPTKDIINIDVNSAVDISKLELFSVTGRLVYKSTSVNTIDISSFNSGVYMLRISGDTGSITRRIIKE